jgi:NAD(P)-dependent dehydrogenase (short-subunit alcohol dehydrogenase family)
VAGGALRLRVSFMDALIIIPDKIADMSTVVMTGGSSGFGKVAVERMTASPDVRVLLGARREGTAGAETFPLDLERLDSVRSFARAVTDRLGATEIDAFVLNAGWFGPADRRTVDGYATTFVVNHLAHYLLARLLAPRLAAGARIVLTTSGTHDPAERAGLPTPHHAEARLLARPELDPRHDERPRTANGRAYTSSKLCVVLTARALAARPELRDRDVTAVAYCPGQVFGTGLMREGGWALYLMWGLLGAPLVRRLVPGNSIGAAGGTLAALALGEEKPPAGRVYAGLRRNRLTWPELAELARRDDVMHALWHDSAALAGLD